MLVVVCGCPRGAGAAPRLLYAAGRRHDSCRGRRTRHGGGAGKDRGANRCRRAETWRQCGRCRGGDRLCHGRDLSARRKHRRRRLHGDPFGEHHEDVAIDYRETAPAATTPADVPRTRRQTRYRKVARFRARHRRSRHRRRIDAGAGKIWLGQIHAGGDCCSRRSSSRATALSSPTTAPIRCRTGTGGWRAGQRRQKIFSRPDGTSLREGDRLVQTDLAATLSAIAEQGPRGILPGPGRRKAGEGDRRRRRHHDVGRPEILSGRRSGRRCAAAIAATTSSRCRSRRPAASCCWRP